MSNQGFIEDFLNSFSICWKFNTLRTTHATGKATRNLPSLSSLWVPTRCPLQTHASVCHSERAPDLPQSPYASQTRALSQMRTCTNGNTNASVCVSTRTHSRVLICCLFGFFCFVFAFALLGQPSPLILGKRMMLRDTYERVHNMLPFSLSHSYSWWLSLRSAVPVLVHLCVNLCIQIGKYRICGSCPPSAASQSVAQRRKQTATAK